MRLFIAVNFSDEIKSRILKVQGQLRSQTFKGNFTRPENLHLTLAFLGETPEARLEDLFHIMEKIQTRPFDILFNQTGCFSSGGKELWWIGADRNSEGLSLLKAIHGQLLKGLEVNAFPVDKKPFNAHITLGREIKHSGPIILNKPEIQVPVDCISVMKSEHLRGVLTYTKLTTREFQVRELR